MYPFLGCILAIKSKYTQKEEDMRLGKSGPYPRQQDDHEFAGLESNLSRRKKENGWVRKRKWGI